MNFKKFLSVLLALVMVLSLAACNGQEETPEATDGAATGAAVAHSVKVTSKGGMPLSEVEVFVYDANDLTDMKGFAETNEEGKASVQLPQGGDYAIVLEGVPAGYEVQESYSFSGTSADIVLTSGLVKDGNLNEVTLGLGDVMYDFTVQAADGSTVTLSEVLAEKEMALINFFFTTCGPCANEFPYMEEAYQMYKDKAAVIALDPLDDTTTVAAYQNSMGLTFPMAACQATWASTFGISGYPTSIVVDRYGVICLIEVGGLTSLSPFTSIFEHFTGDDYEQKLCVNGVADVVTVMKPTTTMPTSEEIAAVVGNGDGVITFANAQESDLEYNWPFVIGEMNGEPCIQTSNKEIEGSYSIIRLQAELKAGQAIGFDYIVSSEANSDVLHVIVNDEPINTIGGYDEVPVWKALYPCVADVDGTYEVSLCYIKDDSNNVGDDCVYMKNVRVVDVADIDTPTYLPRQAATTDDGFAYTYADVVLGGDGYYHVGTEDGPLLLANLMQPSEFNGETYIWNLVYEGGLTVDGVDYSKRMEKYAQYASNSNLTGFCTVTEELAELLKHVDTLYGFDEADTNEWLRACEFYQSYGSNGEQLEDPIAGLAPFSAYTAKLGKNVSTNYFYYNRIIMPRGLLAEFVPTKSGVYRVTSVSESANGVDGWIFDENHKELMVFEMDERMFPAEEDEVSMLWYMEAGKSYYIDIAFWDPYEVGQINYNIEYEGSSIEMFRRCSQSYFTYDSNATGDAMYHLIHGGIDVVLGEDGIYYQDLGNGKKGSKIYCDFTGVTTLFSNPVTTTQVYDEDGKKMVDEDGNPVVLEGMIQMGGFDFSKTEDDLYILSFLEAQGGDVDKTKEYLKGLWGTEYDAYSDIYKVDDVLKGKYHGTGPDLTAEISEYLDDIITSGPKELQGCVVMTERLGEILQLLMDKYTFEDVDQSWVKMCYYYDYIGANDSNIITNLAAAMSEEALAAQEAANEEYLDLYGSEEP